MDQIVEFITNHLILSGIWAGLVVALVYTSIASKLSPIQELSTHDATLLINKEDAVILDIRPPAEFKKGHILGSKQLNQEQINKGEFKALENSKDKPIIIVCAMGVTAKRTAAQMLKAGFARVSVLKGGMNSWQAASLPVAK